MKISMATIAAYKKWLKTSPEAAADKLKRQERAAFFRAWTEDRILALTRDDLIELFAELWSMGMWGNKASYIDQIIDDNELETVQSELANLLYGKSGIEKRWDSFRSKIKRIGPAMASELLAHIYPTEFLPWNKISMTEYQRLGVPKVPKHYYQLDGKAYARLCSIAKDIAGELEKNGIPDVDIMHTNYFLWWHNKFEEETPAKLSASKATKVPSNSTSKEAEFLHNEVRDKLADIGRWLGFESRTEVKVASGSVVDVIWESTIGNMGRVVYVFEVQTKGSIDSLIINLLKALNNPAVQGIVAVSDTDQMTKISSHSKGVPGLGEKLKTWDYTEVLSVHESLESVNQKINGLALVPQGF